MKFPCRYLIVDDNGTRFVNVRDMPQGVFTAFCNRNGITPEFVIKNAPKGYLSVSPNLYFNTGQTAPIFRQDSPTGA